MRLHIAERPLGRHDGRATDDGYVLHEVGRLMSVENEQVICARHDAGDWRSALKLSGEVPLVVGLLFLSFINLAALVARSGCCGWLPRGEHAAIRIAQVHLG